MMKIAVGGTFSPLHAGHTYLIKKAFHVGDEVTIGLTSNKMVNKEIKNYKKRKNNLLDFIKKLNTSDRYKIIKLEDKYGPTIEKEFDAIVVSPETKKTAKEINKKRKENNKKSLEVILTDYILAEDWKPISSTRIRNGEINKKGKITKDN